MAGEARTSSESVNTLAAMETAPWNYDFFQALRRIECEFPERPRLGHSVRLADDPLRLGQKPDCGFAPRPSPASSTTPTARRASSSTSSASPAPTARCRCT